MSVQNTSYYFLCYQESRGKYVELDSNLQLIEKIHMLAEVSFKEKINKEEPTFIYPNEGFTPIFENKVSCKQIQHRILQRISGSKEETDALLKEFIFSHEKKNLPFFSHKILNFSFETSPPPKINEDLRTKALDLLHKNEIYDLGPVTVKNLLLAYEQAMKIHRQNQDSIVTISSKSEAFHSLNECIDKQNKLLLNSSSCHQLAKASIRILPNSCGFITIPGAKKSHGGTKSITLDMSINPDGNLSLVRRYKIQKAFRKNPVYHLLERNIIQSGRISSRRVLSPEVVYKTSKKRIEYVAKNCAMDGFEFLNSLALSEPHRQLNRFHDLSIKEKTEFLVNIMIKVALSVRDLHNSNYLHNDIKPENILLNFDNDSCDVMLSDLDFICTIDEGKGPLCFYGTSLYVKKGIPQKDIHTDLYALAKTFWYDNSKTNNTVSFVYVLTLFEKHASEKKDEELAIRISNLITSVKIICLKMQSSSSKTPMSIDEVIMSIALAKAHFTSHPLQLYRASPPPMTHIQGKTHARSHSI